MSSVGSCLIKIEYIVKKRMVINYNNQKECHEIMNHCVERDYGKNNKMKTRKWEERERKKEKEMSLLKPKSDISTQ